MKLPTVNFTYIILNVASMNITALHTCICLDSTQSRASHKHFGGCVMMIWWSNGLRLKYVPYFRPVNKQGRQKLAQLYMLGYNETLRASIDESVCYMTQKRKASGDYSKG